MDSEWRDGQMEPLMKDLMPRAKSMERESSHGLTTAPTQETSLITTSMAVVFTSGLMEEFTLETGRTIRWKVMELSPGQMEENTLGSTLMI
jgi:hypothetical protein